MMKVLKILQSFPMTKKQLHRSLRLKNLKIFTPAKTILQMADQTAIYLSKIFTRRQTPDLQQNNGHAASRISAIFKREKALPFR